MVTPVPSRRKHVNSIHTGDAPVEGIGSSRPVSTDTTSAELVTVVGVELFVAEAIVGMVLVVIGAGGGTGFFGRTGVVCGTGWAGGAAVQRGASIFLTNDQPCIPEGSSPAFSMTVNVWSIAPSKARSNRNSAAK